MTRPAALILELRWTLNGLRRARRGWSDLLRALYMLALVPCEIMGGLLVRERALTRDPRRILVIKTDQLGDVLFATQVMAPLRERFPEAEIDWLVQPKTAVLLEGDPDIRRVRLWHELTFALLPGRLGASWREVPRLARENLATVRAIRRGGYDLAINGRMRPPSGNPIWALLGVPLLGWNGVDWSFVARFRAESELRDPHAMYANLLAPLGIRNPRLHPRISIGKSEAAGLAAPYAVFSPATYDRDRGWQLDAWRELARRCIGAGMTVAVVGTPEQDAILRAIADGFPDGTVRVMDRVTIPEYATLMRGASCFAGIESFPAHLALACDVPGVCFVNADRYYVAGLSDERAVMSASLVPSSLSLRALPLTATPDEAFAALR